MNRGQSPKTAIDHLCEGLEVDNSWGICARDVNANGKGYKLLKETAPESKEKVIDHEIIGAADCRAYNVLESA